MNTVAGRHVGQNIISFRFALQQRVRIDAIDITGLVLEMNVDCNGKNYLIAYFDDDKVRRREWLSEIELSATLT